MTNQKTQQQRTSVFLPPERRVSEGMTVHTWRWPFCRDLSCRCHLDVWRIRDYLIRPVRDGLMTWPEGVRLYNGLDWWEGHHGTI